MALAVSLVTWESILVPVVAMKLVEEGVLLDMNVFPLIIIIIISSSSIIVKLQKMHQWQIT